MTTYQMHYSLMVWFSLQEQEVPYRFRSRVDQPFFCLFSVSTLTITKFSMMGGAWVWLIRLTHSFAVLKSKLSVYYAGKLAVNL